MSVHPPHTFRRIQEPHLKEEAGSVEGQRACERKSLYKQLKEDGTDERRRRRKVIEDMQRWKYVNFLQSTSG